MNFTNRLSYKTRARPHLMPQFLNDNRQRTGLEDLPPEVKWWIEKAFNVYKIEPVNWLVNSNHCFRAFAMDVTIFFKIINKVDALDRMNREKAILQHLYASGIPVPHYLSSQEFGSEMACIVTEWIEARPVRYLDINGSLGKDYMTELGSLVRAMHKALATAELSFLPKQTRYDYDLESVVATAERLLGSAIAIQLKEWLVISQDLLASWSETPLHGDLQDKNLLLTDDGFLYICDFEAARKDVILRDLFVDRFLLKAKIDPNIRDLYQKQLCKGYGVERVEKLLPDAWSFMRADFYATQIAWLEQNNVQRLEAEEKVRWNWRMTELQNEIAKGKAPKRNAKKNNLIPQWYFGTADVLTSHPSFEPLIPIVKEVFGQSEIRVDCQSNTVDIGVCIGIPDWQLCEWATDSALLMFDAEEKFLEIRDKNGKITNPEPKVVLQIRATDSLRFLPVSKRQSASLILVRSREKNTPSPLSRVSCRLFPTKSEVESDDWEAIGGIKFVSWASVLGKMPRKTTWEDIIQEPSISLTRIDTALSFGGRLVREFIEALPDDWRDPDADVVISVQRNELSPDWNPTPVGWHIDGTHMANRLPNGRPDLRNPGNTAEQIVACCGTGAPTRFLLGEVTLSEAPMDVEHGSRWQKELKIAVDKGALQYWLAPIDTLVKFGFGSFHTGSNSVEPGWRCFIKAMRGRGDITVRSGVVDRSNVSWPAENAYLPTDPCGVFPDKLP
jgi:tRNA A-37 threonylcarbamoyl transferase component Bud32